MRNITSWITLFACCLTLSACGGGGGGGGGGDPGGGASSSAASLSLQMAFERNTGASDGSFRVRVWLRNGNGQVVPFSTAPGLNLARGSASTLTTLGDGRREALVTPDATLTGEYPVTVSASVNGSTQSLTRTALVLGQVASGWGQPVMVEGLVNTGGTQDSLAVSPDGQYLFVQYYPVSLSCILSGNPNSASCQSPLGPVTAPARPNMPGANRVGTNSVHHGCPSVGFDPSPVPVPPIALYGFRRQADGSFAEPFVFRFNGGDGCFAPWGPTLRANGNGSYRMITAFNDPRNGGTASDFAHLYSLDFTPGNTIPLGDVVFAGSLQINNFALIQQTVGGIPTHRGNPHVHYNGSTPSLLFYDEETKAAANQFIQVSSWTGSAWTAPLSLNFAQFNANGHGNTQPFFDGSQLILREGLQLLRYGYNGGSPALAASWSGPTVLLAPGINGLTGSVIVVGEPNIATVNGQQLLYFVYGLKQADGNVNIRVGYVPAS